jgi:hypothetical protein
VKIGKFDVSAFVAGWTWTRNRIIAAAVGGAFVLVGLGMMIGRSNGPAAEPVEEVPAYPSQVQLPADLKKQSDFLSRGAMMFIFFHETGHMLITELKLPVVGPEEDVVDEFSTFFLTDMIKESPDRVKDIYANVVVAGALFWKLSAQQHDVRNFPFYDEHSPDDKRFFNILCIATGADPLRFIPMAVKQGVPESRLASCAEEYKKKHAAWDALIGPHMKGSLAKALHMGGRMKLQIGPVGKGEWLPYELTFRQGGYFQQMLDGLSDNLDLPDDVPVIPKTCNGTVNAFWSPDDKSITICHEMFQHVVDLFDTTLAQGQQQQQQGGQQPVPGQDNPQPPPGGGQGDNAVAFLSGRWVCNEMAPNGMTGTGEYSLAPDGQFTVREQASNGIGMQGWGRWSAPAANTIRYDFQGVNPPQLCGPQGCMPTVQNPTIVMYRVTGPNSMALQGATCSKSG